LFRRVDQIVARGLAEAESYRCLGLPTQKIQIIPPGVADLAILDPQSSIPGVGRFVACAGPLQPHKGFRDAIWAFDILQYLFNDLTLMILGSGPDQERLERFARATGAARRVRFAGSQPNLAPLLARAEVVWVPSRAEGGFSIALEAMALGRPVVASRLPGLAEIVADGETGFLVPSGDKIELARRTRLLLDDPDRSRTLGEAGRQRVDSYFGAADFVRRWADLFGTASGRMTA
jgi:glycosyltransferase involved in cell wall biosynthesis